MRILVIDDEPYNLKAMEIILQLASRELNLNTEVIKDITDFCCSGVEAVEKVRAGLEEDHLAYGLVITDLSMPVLDGFQVSMKIRKFYHQKAQAQPYIVTCTGHSEEMYIKKAWTHLIDEVIPKPARKEVIKEILEQVFKQA
jgi:CheY-like chemotaxis protein